MSQKRLEELQSQLQARDVDCLALMPGTNMRYMTGLDFHLMERPTVLFIPAEGTPSFALPALEMAKLDGEQAFHIQPFPWADEQGPDEAFRAAIEALPEVHIIAMEYLAMRVLELKLIQRRVPNAILQDGNPIMDVLRQQKTAEEIELMREAVAISEAALAEVIAEVETGMTEREIASKLTQAQHKRGGELSPFEPIVLAGERSALPHGGPTDRKIRAGDVLLIDFGTRRGGYVSDITRTFVVSGELLERERDVYEAVKRANTAAREIAGPGVTGEAVDDAARKVIEKAGYGEFFIHRTGHGIGLDAHEPPYIVAGNEAPLEIGMTFTIEPGIYIPREIGVRIEDDVVVTAEGIESLTSFSRAMTVIGEDG